jgi:hypothetical protein
MLAILGVILLVIAAFLKATAGNPSIMIWLIIVGAILIGVDVAWGWNRGGRTYRRV